MAGCTRFELATSDVIGLILQGICKNGIVVFPERIIPQGMRATKNAPVSAMDRGVFL